MLTIKLEEDLIQKIATAAGVERKTIHCYPYEQDSSSKTIYLNKVPKAFLTKLRDHYDLGNPTRVLVENYMTPHNEVLGKKASTLHEVFALLSGISGRGDILGVQAGKLIFPVTIKELAYRDDAWGNRVTICYGFNYGDNSANEYKSIYPEHLKDLSGASLSLQEILNKANFKPFGEVMYKEHIEAVGRMHRMQTEMTGKMVQIKGPVYVKPFWGSLPVEIQIGANSKKAIVECDLELHESMWYNNTDNIDEVVPLVRVFLLERKVYCYVHINNVTEHVYDTAGFSKVVLPENVRSLFERIFSAGPESHFGDIFGGRHGGTVILADGPPGVGKTLTAEAVAELSKRPLYVADVGEIGIDLDSVEDKLKLVLERASKWNAVLLLDEADIFLVKRDVDNIERNAIVGTFLKFLDGFDGTLFLTTNRVDVIDPAFASRITARVHYDALDATARLKIWERMVEAAKLKISKKSLDSLAEHKFNGRQIRNLVRLTKMYHRDKELVLQDVTMLFAHVLKVDETWVSTPSDSKEQNQ